MTVTVIGGGIGGYTCAIRLSQLGADVTLVEKENMGGTCLNRGCMPTKVVLQSAKSYHALNSYDEFGIEIDSDPFLDFEKVIARKDRIVAKLRGGVEHLMKKNKIKVVYGTASFISSNRIEVKKENGTETIESDYFVIATGSRPATLPVAVHNGESIIDSTDILQLKELPETLAVLGGGVVGCEFAQAFSMMDTEVTIIEMMPSILSMFDDDISALITEQFKKNGIEIKTGTRLLEATPIDNGVELRYEVDGKEETKTVEKLLVSTGRLPNVEELSLNLAGIKQTDSGHIETDAFMCTNVENIYAIGDVTGGKYQLSHMAAHQGLTAASNIMGDSVEIDPSCVPMCAYVYPEIATIGVAEKDADFQVKVGRFSAAANGKSMVENDTAGFAKVVTDADDGIIKGVQLALANATEMISYMAGMIKFEANTDDVAEWFFAHPTVSEAVGEAILDVDGFAINK